MATAMPGRPTPAAASLPRRLAAAASRLLLGEPGPVTFRVSAGLFLRLLGGVYLVAFTSLWVQIEGLVGSRGILPVARLLAAAAEQLGPERYRLLPTLCWLDPGDAFLHLQCAAGVVLALLVLAGMVQVPALLGLWGLYLSLAVAGQDFLSFQWDVLLLETGLLAVFLFPPRLRVRPATLPRPSPLALGLLRWLLFRLMFRSGLVKLTSGDPTWRDLSALDYHYQTQPLPTWIGWWAHQLPGWFQAASTALMFVLELAAPFLLFAPARLRRPAVWALVAFQLLIAATGNYTFFNLLAIVLCLLQLDDACWPRRWRRSAASQERPPATGRRGRAAQARRRRGAEARGQAPEDAPAPPRWWVWSAAPLAAVVLVVSSVQMVDAFRVPVSWPAPVVALERWLAPWRSVNPYGLFQVMTTERPEIVVEGSDDGRSWRAYGFRWKPGEVDRRPRFVAPHQPRLDWQMWFAALGGYQGHPWFVAFLARLAEGSPEVLSLLDHDPFPQRPPRYLRALLYDYRFTDLATRRATGAWWRRDLRGLYFPEIPAERLVELVQ